MCVASGMVVSLTGVLLSSFFSKRNLICIFLQLEDRLRQRREQRKRKAEEEARQQREEEEKEKRRNEEEREAKAKKIMPPLVRTT